MDAHAPISLITATYSTRGEAVEDFGRGGGTRHQGEFHHTSLSVLTKNSGGSLNIDLNNSTAKHLSWGGALLGGGLFILAHTAGVELLSSVGLSGAGAVVRHFALNTDPVELAQATTLLEEGAARLVVVA